ncbi:MAG: NAD(P)-binding protein, partial [Sandaracinaceae bacterium]|nr:NAD(P)-binding protein [Sandaracinaceae bacterium]
MERFDWVVVGSGFGGSVCALRLIEKGYSVLVIEKGRRFSAGDFPRTNWDLRDWMWAPRLGLRGFFQIDFFEHLTVAHGVGVGGGSLTYANTLPVPGDGYFDASSWAHLADWRRELAPHYRPAQRMLGATPNPRDTFPRRGDPRDRRRDGARGQGRAGRRGVFFRRTRGRGRRSVLRRTWAAPHRLHLLRRVHDRLPGRREEHARQELPLLWRSPGGARVRAQTEVVAIRPSDGGYDVVTRPSFGISRARSTVRAERVVFAGGVLGTVPLLLALRADRAALPALSPRVGTSCAATARPSWPWSRPRATRTSRGVAITSIFETDELQPLPSRSAQGAARTSCASSRSPYAPAPTLAGRLYRHGRRASRRTPRRWAKGARDARHLGQDHRWPTCSRSRHAAPAPARGKRLVTEIDDPTRAPTPFSPSHTSWSSASRRRSAGCAGGVARDAPRGPERSAHPWAARALEAERGRRASSTRTRHRVHGYHEKCWSLVSPVPGLTLTV